MIRKAHRARRAHGLEERKSRRARCARSFWRGLFWTLPAFAQTAIPPSTSADYAARAAAHLASGQAQLAVDEYSQAIRLRLDDAGAWTDRGRAYNQLGRYSAAIDDFDQPVRLDPRPALPFIERGYAYGRIGDFERAIQDFDRAMERDPANARALSLRGTAYSVTGQSNKALADRERVVKLTPNAAEAYVARAETYYMLGRYAEGLADQTKAIALQPDYEIAWAARGASYVALQRAPEAIGDLEQALKLKPDDAQAARLLAQARAIAALSRQPESVVIGSVIGPSGAIPPPPWMQSFPELPLPIPSPQILVPLAAAPGDTASAVLHNQRGRELTKLGRHHSAIEELTAAIAADRTYAPAYNARGFAYYMLRDYTRALADFDRAIELMPGYKNAIDNRAAARRAAGFKIER